MSILQGDCLAILKTLPDESVDSLVTDPPAGISFMGKAWDDDKGGRDAWVAWMAEVMRECKRVLKPGAHALVWAIPRTSHWTATAIEDAGFEIRDVVTHLFGSGFPKSLDISKAIDKEAGAKRSEVIGQKPYQTNGNVTSGNFGVTAENDPSKRFTENILAPATNAAKKWQGFGTALKPAAEFWVLARKPLSEKTVAKNVLKHGTGGLNIDGSRVGTEVLPAMTAGQARIGTFERANMVTPERTGRFPANLVLSGDAIEALDEQARFFYCAKVSPSERGADNKHPTVKALKLMEYLIKLITPPGGIVLDPFSGSGSTGVAAIRSGFAFIGIEREPEYVAIAQARLDAVGS